MESKLKPYKSELAEEFLEKTVENSHPIIEQLQANIELRDTPVVKQLKNGLYLKRD